MIKDKQTIKSLQTQLEKSKGDYNALKIQVDLIQKSLTSKKEEIKGLESKISKLEKPSELCVSEHALIRYFERILGFNLDDIRAKILDSEVRRLSSILGENGTYPTKEGFRVILKDNVVTTVGI